MSNKPRYVFIAPWSVKAGTGVNNVILGLKDAISTRYTTEIVVTGWTAPEPGHTWCKLNSCELPVRNLLGVAARFLPSMVRLRRILRGAAVVNPHYFSLELLPLALLRRLNLCPTLVLSVHGADITEAEQSTGFRRRLYRWLYESADTVTACSHALARKVRSVTSRSTVEVVHNGVLRPHQPPGNRPMQQPYIVSVAAFVAKKGHDTLLQAFLLVSAFFPELKLVLIGGNGPERENVLARIVKLGLKDRVTVHVNLPHDQTWNWIHYAECFVLASRDEPFGIAVLEAGVAGVPAVTTNVGGIPEFLTNEVHGLTCDPDSPDSLASAIVETLKDRKKTEERVAAFHHRASGFTWELAAAKYESFLGLPNYRRDYSPTEAIGS